MTIVQSEPIGNIPSGNVTPANTVIGTVITSVSGNVSGSEHIHHQTTPASTWNIDHDLGVPREPVVILDDEPDIPVWTDTYHTTPNHTDLVFPQPVSGYAYF